MSSKGQSPRQSKTSSPAPPKRTTRSLIVLKFVVDESEEKLLENLLQNYHGIEKVFQRHDRNGNPLNSIRIDFVSDNLAMPILDNGSIICKGKKYPVRPYWPVICYRCQNEGHHISECPQQPLTERRLREMFKEQQMQFQQMIDAFETKWNERLKSLSSTSASNTQMQQLIPIFKDLTTTYQQFSQQNVLLQRQLGSVVNRVNEMQMKIVNGQAATNSPVQNGH